jgi:hypothetical protein
LADGDQDRPVASGYYRAWRQGILFDQGIFFDQGIGFDKVGLPAAKKTATSDAADFLTSQIEPRCRLAP